VNRKQSIVERLAGLLIGGVSAETLALSIALGVVLGVFPVYGCPTLLCAAAAVILRLNPPAVQLVNYLATPLQLALLIPLNRLGSRLFHAPGGVLHVGAWEVAHRVYTAALNAVAGWVCVCVPLGILLYWILACLLRRYRQRQSFNGTAA
jgi:uncharacterized protein (DUF2062 family)